MRLIIENDDERVAETAANYIKKRILDFAPTETRPFVLGLPTGSTPVQTYEKLVAMHKRGELSFEFVVSFNMDEYCDLPREHAESYWTFMHKHLFSHVDIKKENINMLDGNAEDLAKECNEYEAKIASVGGIELFLAGLGADGHIAFDEPGSSLSSRTRVKTLASSTIRDNSRFFGGDVSAVPKRALTVGVATVMDSREVVMLITGAHKALALSKCVEEGVSHMWTASALQLHPRAMVICDEDATLELRVKTVKYFKGIMETMQMTDSEAIPEGHCKV